MVVHRQDKNQGVVWRSWEIPAGPGCFGLHFLDHPLVCLKGLFLPDIAVRDYRRFNVTQTSRCLIQIGESQALLALMNPATARPFHQLFRCFIHLQFIFPTCICNAMVVPILISEYLRHLDVLKFGCESHHSELL